MYVHVPGRRRRTVFETGLPADPAAFFNAIEPYRRDLVVGVECMLAWYWLADPCAEEGIPLALGHAPALKHTGRAGRRRNCSPPGPGQALFQ